MTIPRDAESLVKAHQAGVWRYLRFLGCDRATADDLTQDAFVAALDGDFEDHHPAQTAAWLRRTARNLFLSHVRRTARIRGRSDLDAADRAWERGLGDENGGAERLAALRACIETLDERARRALTLSYGADGANAARELGESHANLRVILHRAKQMLRRCIERRLESGG